MFVFLRFLDWDEGFYLMAGRSVADGMRLYFDFFHPQAPGYPHLLAILAHGGWDMLFQARVVNALLSLATMALVTLAALRLQQSRDVSEPKNTMLSALTALFLYGFSGMFLSWNTVAKPLALSQFLAVFAFYSCLRAGNHTAFRSILWVFLAGAGVTLAAQTRLPLIIIWPLLFAHVLLSREIRHKALSVLAYLTGTHLAAIPSIILWLTDWRRFLYNNLGFHLARDESPELGAVLYDKLRTISKLLVDPQLLIILGLTALILWLSRKSVSPLAFLRKPRLLAVLIGAVVLGAYLQAFPSLRQYAVQALPFFIIFVSAGAPEITRLLRKRFANARRITLVMLALYVAGIIPYLAIYFVTVRGYDRKSIQARVKQVVQVIRNSSASSDIVFAESPIYPLLAQRPALPLTEFVGFQYKSLALGDRYMRMNLPDSLYLLKEVANATPQVVVIDNKPDPGLEARLAERYDLIFSDDYTQVYRRKDESH